MEVQADWIMVHAILDQTVVDIDDALAATGLGTPQLRKDAAASDTVAVYKTTIYPLDLVHLLLGYPSSTKSTRVT